MLARALERMALRESSSLRAKTDCKVLLILGLVVRTGCHLPCMLDADRFLLKNYNGKALMREFRFSFCILIEPFLRGVFFTVFKGIVVMLASLFDNRSGEYEVITERDGEVGSGRSAAT